MQIPILEGVYTDADADFRVQYPVNMMPIVHDQGISRGYLRPHDGLVQSGTGPGISRGGINWDGLCYRVMGPKLVIEASNGAITEIGNVGTDGKQVSLDYSFDYLGIVSSKDFYLYDGATLQQVTDPDLRDVIDHIWVDGYFMLTDGEFIIVTELNDSFAINPTKYGSSEVDPDPVKALLKLRNEPYVLNRYTIEVFDNVGGSGFPFRRIDGAQIQRGTIGTHACCTFLEAIAFVGGGRKEAIAVWLAESGSSRKISTREIDKLLEEYSEDELSTITVESRVDKNGQLLYINLPKKTLVFDEKATRAAGKEVWFILSSGLLTMSRFRAKDLVWCYNLWLAADTESAAIGQFDDSVAEHWGEIVPWEFNTAIIYNEGNGAIFHELELVALSGRNTLTSNPTVYTSHSTDGEMFTPRRPVRAAKQGNRKKRLVWLNQGPMRHWRIQKFEGRSDAMLSVARLEARLEALAV